MNISGFRCEKYFYFHKWELIFHPDFQLFHIGKSKNVNMLILYLKEKEEIYGQCFLYVHILNFDHVFIFCQILHEFKFLPGWDILDKLQSKLEVHGKTILEFKTNAGKEKLAPIKTKIMATTSDQERKCRYH